MSPKSSVEKRIKEIRRNTRRKYSAEEKVRIVIEGLRGEDSIAALCRREGINQKLVRPLEQRLPGSREKTHER